MDKYKYDNKRTRSVTRLLEQSNELLGQGNFEKAEETITIIPNSNRTAEWYYMNGRILKHRGRFLDAQTQFEAAVKLDPNNQTYIQAADELKNSANGYTDTWNTQSDDSKESKQTGCCGEICCEGCGEGCCYGICECICEGCDGI